MDLNIVMKSKQHDGLTRKWSKATMWTKWSHSNMNIILKLNWLRIYISYRLNCHCHYHHQHRRARKTFRAGRKIRCSWKVICLALQFILRLIYTSSKCFGGKFSYQYGECRLRIKKYCKNLVKTASNILHIEFRHKYCKLCNIYCKIVFGTNSECAFTIMVNFPLKHFTESVNQPCCSSQISFNVFIIFIIF